MSLQVIKKEKDCPICSIKFTPENNYQVYCSRPCRTKRQNSIKNNKDWRKIPKICKWCGISFIIPENSSPIRAYCSHECQCKGYSKIRDKFWKKNPQAMSKYNTARRIVHGRTDTFSVRLRRKYKDIPTCCEAENCNESRVLDFAHKPEFKRNGAHMVMKHYERHMFWVLCPTHHALIDRAGINPSEFGLY